MDFEELLKDLEILRAMQSDLRRKALHDVFLEKKNQSTIWGNKGWNSLAGLMYLSIQQQQKNDSWCQR